MIVPGHVEIVSLTFSIESVMRSFCHTHINRVIALNPHILI